MIKLIATITLFVFICSCDSAKLDSLKTFYFPLESLGMDGLVYEYQTLEAPFQFEYWYYKSIENEGKKYLISVNYNHEGEQQQMNIERIVESGVLLDSLVIYNKMDSLSVGLISANIESNIVFPFYPEDSTFVYLKRINWLENDKRKNTIIQNRRFIGTDSINLNDENIKTAIFKLNEVFEIDSVGTLSIESSGHEWYAENIGLVRKEKNIEGFPPIKLEFVRRMSFDAFKDSLNK